ncbi:MAG: ABC transporter ATP-binding protein [Anaerolineae bacterium]|jgi:ABC-2 type transport system ATP-binding protein|uniref:ABC transporter ATP-binding protein n=1 Tax=Candidatus Flexifilum breve TaxID=3140694 RepID=UPI001AC6394F|nr:ABC transporter ATP-binding protein [Chloroflexota bacterium]MBK9747305.1 ABC transporter ATP-binding protein [Chloroflexota bacterium]MBN8634518.1 ABC transporter ATP-binding protein [Anaerolineae bacterium]
MIEVENLTKSYGEVAAVKGISFTARPGQVTGFLGPNGAGKTTTMRILTGFMPPTSGKAMVAGFDVFNQSLDVRKRVGYLPENVPLYRDMTALGYLTYIGEIRGVRKVKARAQEVLERVGLGSRANSHIRALSKGMRQRVGLAQALLHNPPVLILDEPTIGLDPIQVLELRDLVAELGKDHTVLFSTHILSEAEQVCDSVVIINQGEIIAQGSPTELRSSLLERGSRVLVRVDGPAAAALPIIQQVASVGHAESGSEGIVVTPAQPDVDPRPHIARALIQNNLNLQELRPLAVNLEEIFLELTRRRQAAEVVEAPVTETTEDQS